MQKKTNIDTAKLDKIVAQAKQDQLKREQGYREQALKLYPWICGRCQREFTLKNLSELTVHHRDHNHDNNPSDGSNWELLCLYCHDNEHAKYLDHQSVTSGDNQQSQQSIANSKQTTKTTYSPFANLKDMLNQ